jgi:group I intron endonuclease
MIGIYRIRNLVNNKCYIGSSKNINRRWHRHKCGLRNNHHENVILQRAWNKYGEENFVFEVIEECDLSILLETEQKYLDLNPKYNIGKKSSGGDNLSHNPNKEEIIRKITSAVRNWVNNMTDDEKIKKFSMPLEKNPNWKGGVTYNYCICGKKIVQHAKHCNKCRPRNGENNPFYNKKHSDETIKKLSKKQLGIYRGTQNIKFFIDDKEYFSLGEASKQLYIPVPTILWRLKSSNKKFENYKYSQD